MNKMYLSISPNSGCGGGGQLTSPSCKTVMLAFMRLYLVGNVLAAVSMPVISFHCFRILAQSSPLSRMATIMRSASPASAHEVGIGTLLLFALPFFGGGVEIPSVATDAFGFVFFCLLFLGVVVGVVGLSSGSGLTMPVGVISSFLAMRDSGVVGA